MLLNQPIPCNIYSICLFWRKSSPKLAITLGWREAFTNFSPHKRQETVNVIKDSLTVPLIWNAQCKLLWPAIVDEIAAPSVNQNTNIGSHKTLADCGLYFVYFGYPPSQDSMFRLKKSEKTLQKQPPKTRTGEQTQGIPIYTWTFPSVWICVFSQMKTCQKAGHFTYLEDKGINRNRRTYRTNNSSLDPVTGDKLTLPLFII